MVLLKKAFRRRNCSTKAKKEGSDPYLSILNYRNTPVVGDIGVHMLKELTNAIEKEYTIPDDWLKSVLVNSYKGK